MWYILHKYSSSSVEAQKGEQQQGSRSSFADLEARQGEIFEILWSLKWTTGEHTLFVAFYRLNCVRDELMWGSLQEPYEED